MRLMQRRQRDERLQLRHQLWGYELGTRVMHAAMHDAVPNRGEPAPAQVGPPPG
jgi:hypothetical protein